jgi:hypothetical protein
MNPGRTPRQPPGHLGCAVGSSFPPVVANLPSWNLPAIVLLNAAICCCFDGLVLSVVFHGGLGIPVFSSVEVPQVAFVRPLKMIASHPGRASGVRLKLNIPPCNCA